MNRFLTKKRAKDSALPIERPSANMPSPALINTNTKKGWRWKRQQPQAAPLPELSFVLPTSDNFRTSLIMPNLSARFSMLREQDDPMSILGKASDDSVLEPRRRSRLVEFGFSGGTADIAESTFFTVPVGPLFTTPPKQGSYGTGDGYGTEEDSLYTGSMMSRAKSGEGNVLFGGRQKIFKIPVGDAGAVSNLSSGESRGMRGRALYGDDVSTLAFQVMREKERQDERGRKLAELHCDMDNESLGKCLNSPLAAAYNERRETASSTNSGPSTTSSSTVATSLTSQSTVSVPSPSPSLAPSPQSPSPNSPNPERSLTRHRKWYNEGLDHHSPEQKSAAVGRLSTSHKTRSATRNPSPRHLPQSRNALTTRESFKRRNSASRTPSSSSADEARTTSDAVRLTKMTNSRTGLDYSRLQAKNNPEDVGKALSQAVHPNDREKATAMGTFSKPSQQFDEKQYLQRQMSLIQQQRRSRSNTSTSRLTDSPSQLSSGQPSGEGLARGQTTLTERPWSLGSDSGSEPGVLFMRRTSNQPQISYRSKQVLPSPPGILFAPTDDNGDDEGEASGRVPRNSLDPSFQKAFAQIPPVPRREPPPMLNHPAMKLELAQAKKERRNGWSPPPDMDSFPPNVMPFHSSLLHDQSSMSYVKNLTSPDAAKDTDLSTLVREHLRHASNQSSIHAAPPRSIYGDASEIEVPEFGIRVPSVYAEASRSGNNECGSPQSGAMNYEAYFRMSNGHESSNLMIRSMMPFSHNSEMCDPPSGDGDWERELRKQHSRGGSSETWQEREAFAIELAERQRAIQENLKIKVENGSRPPSPMSHSPASKSVFETTFKPFGLLKSGTSRELLTKGEPKLRGKLSAMGNVSGTSSSGNEKRPSEDSKRIREGAMSPVMGRTLHFRMPHANEEQSRSSKEQSRSRKSSAASRERRPPSRRSPLDSSKSSSQNSVRARSSSEISSAGCSNSHLARHRDDLEKAMSGLLARDQSRCMRGMAITSARQKSCKRTIRPSTPRKVSKQVKPKLRLATATVRTIRTCSKFIRPQYLALPAPLPSITLTHTPPIPRPIFLLSRRRTSAPSHFRAHSYSNTPPTSRCCRHYPQQPSPSLSAPHAKTLATSKGQKSPSLTSSP